MHISDVFMTIFVPQWNQEVQVHTMQQAFQSKNQFEDPLLSTGVKPQRCTHCNYSANQGASLKKHILKHTGENPRHCQQCEHTSTLKVR